MLVLSLVGWSNVSAFAAVTLEVAPADGANSRDLDFETVESMGPQGEEALERVVVRRVRVTISDSSNRYQVFQRVNAPLTNSNGTEFPLKAIRFFLSTAGRGDLRVPNPVPLEMGERVVYDSDATGSPTELLFNYTVEVPYGQEAGQYQGGSISYVVTPSS
mgnify:CR=1 FL=1